MVAAVPDRYLPAMSIDTKALDSLFRSTGLQKPDDAVGFLLWRVAHRYQREIDRVCADVDLTHLQFVVLVIAAWLARGGIPVTQSRLVAFSNIHPMQVSTLLATLDQKGLVTPPRDQADERRKFVEITGGGVEALTQALPLVEAAQVRFFATDAVAGRDLHDALRRMVRDWTSP